MAGPFAVHSPVALGDADGDLIYRGRALIATGGDWTNNDAEYIGLYLGLKKCWELGTNKVHHLTDSQMVSKIKSGESAPAQFNMRRYNTRVGMLKHVMYSTGGE